MTNEHLENVSISEIVKMYVIEWERSFDEYYSINAKESNKYFLRACALYNEIESRGANGRSAIVELLKHPHIRVRVMTAALAINLVPELAVPVLEAPEIQVFPWENINATFVLKRFRGNDGER